jgi:hypothetical protein
MTVDVGEGHQLTATDPRSRGPQPGIRVLERFLGGQHRGVAALRVAWLAWSAWPDQPREVVESIALVAGTCEPADMVDRIEYVPL